jgi:carbon-monoxide dehydrogenase small subunit
MTIVKVTVNDQEFENDVPDNTLLAFFLRETLGLTGTHVGCDTSQCGCCVVIVDGLSIKSCTTLVHQIDGAHIQTIEGLAKNNELHPIQEAFTQSHALQCGYCTPGMVMSALDLIEHCKGNLTPEIIRAQMEGNLCRCTGYHNIVKAIDQAHKAIKHLHIRDQPEKNNKPD